MKRPLSNRELALEYAMQLALNAGTSAGQQVVSNAEVFLNYLDGDNTPNATVIKAVPNG